MSPLDQLTARLRARDRSAVYEFAAVRRHRLLAYIEGQLGQHLWGKVDAVDVFQEVLLAGWQHLPATDLTARDPFGWLCDLADQKVVDFARRYTARKRDVGNERHLDGSVDGNQTTPSGVVAREQEAEAVREAVGELPTEVREVVRMRYEEGLPTQRIAERVGKTDGAVRTLLSRALGTLRRLLGKKIGDEEKSE